LFSREGFIAAPRQRDDAAFSLRRRTTCNSFGPSWISLDRLDRRLLEFESVKDQMEDKLLGDHRPGKSLA
jgi:hypothetical protein